MKILIDGFCSLFCNMYEYYDKRVYELKDHDAADYYAALKKIREWNYHDDAPIGLGVFYRKETATFDQRSAVSGENLTDAAIDKNIKKVLSQAT